VAKKSSWSNLKSAASRESCLHARAIFHIVNCGKLDRKTAKNHSQSFALLSFKQNIFNQVGQAGQSATLSDLVQTTDICKEIISNNETTFCCLRLVQLGALSRNIIG
jgi:hypothetical protein